MVGTTELESVTSCMSSKRSNQLSYAPVDNDYHTPIPRACQAFLHVNFIIFRFQRFLYSYISVFVGRAKSFSISSLQRVTSSPFP